MKTKEWADFVKDNRIGPLLRELGDAIDGCDDPVTLSKAANVLKFMSGSANTRRYYAEKEQRNRSWSGNLGDDNGG